jgi:type VI secretion system secreted protein Hcp
MSQQEASRVARAAERIRRSRGGMLKLAVPTAAALGAGAALAVGSIPGSDQTITACYGNVTDRTDFGALRLIDPSAGGSTLNRSCGAFEATITWNQRGPQGPQGPQGTNGAAGANGAPLLGSTSFGLHNNSGKTFLKIEGIDGTSTDSKHRDWIELSSYELGTQGGAAASKVRISSFTFTKKQDKSSPLLFKACANGKHISKGILVLARKAGKGQQEFLRIKLDSIVMSNFQSGLDASHQPAEQVTLTFQKLNETFVDNKGHVEGSVGWNVNSNVKL